MAKRATYYSESVEQILDVTKDGSESFSGRVGFMVSAAAKVAADECPTLGAGEWGALADANCGTVYSYDQGAESVVSGMLHNLFDFAEEGDTKWNVDCVGLARRVSALPFAQRFAVFEIVRRFWTHGDVVSQASNYADAFRSLGARVEG